MLGKMRAPNDGGSRIGIVFNGSALFTGDAGSAESNIRQWIIENDWLEAVVALPDQFFYNTGISTYIWVLTNRKEQRHKGKGQRIDGRRFFVKMPKSLGKKATSWATPPTAKVSPTRSPISGSMSFRVETRLTRRARLGSARTEGRDITSVRNPTKDASKNNLNHKSYLSLFRGISR